MLRVLWITPLRLMLTMRAFSWPTTSRFSCCGLPVKPGRFDMANTSAVSDIPSSVVSKRLVEFTVVGEPLVAVPAGKSTLVWNTPIGLFSFRQTNPPVMGS